MDQESLTKIMRAQAEPINDTLQRIEIAINTLNEKIDSYNKRIQNLEESEYALIPQK